VGLVQHYTMVTDLHGTRRISAAGGLLDAILRPSDQPAEESALAPRAPGARQELWSRGLLRALLWSTLAKLVALLILWWLCFAGHASPTPASMGSHLNLAAPASSQGT
jgi:hypothetical protein